MTREQAATLAAIRKLTVDGVSPSYVEIALELGLSPKSKDVVRRRLLRLRGLGLVTFEPHLARSIRLVGDNAPYTAAALCKLDSGALRELISTASGILWRAPDRLERGEGG